MTDKEYFSIDNSSGKKTKESWLKKYNQDLYFRIIEFVNFNNVSTKSFVEKVWYYINDITNTKKCFCGNELKFKNLNLGFSQYCSIKCSNKDPKRIESIKQTNLEKYGVVSSFQSEETKKKIKQTNLERYGVENPSQSEFIQEKKRSKNLERYGVDHFSKTDEFKEKVKQTNLERYGVDHFSKTDEFKEKVKQTNLERYGVDCISHSDEIKEKAKQTNLERYGVENPSQSEEVKEKVKQTNLERYGVENPSQSEEVKEKVKQTNLERYGVICTLHTPENICKKKQTWIDNYGVENPSQSEEVKEKTKQTNLERYGGVSPIHSNKIKNKIKETWLGKLIDKYSNYNFVNSNGLSVTFKCIFGHTFEISKNLLSLRNSLNYELCTICNPIGTYTKSESEVNEYLESNQIETIRNNRTILNGKELDILIPSHNLAIEYNGLYWHSDLKDRIHLNYHLDKTEQCESKNIRLIHIFEDEWLFKQDIVKSRLLNLLGLTPNKVFGRKCDIRQVSTKDSRIFLDNNHIQGYVNSSIRLGLYHNDELVSLMTFGGLRKNLGQTTKNGSFELLRFCNKLNTNVVGGASKLFKHFINNYDFESIISYADRRWSQGKLYETLGFEFLHNTKPNYYYTKGRVRENRFKYRKSELVKQGYDPNKTENEIMVERGFGRIYDCGSNKYEFTKQ